MMMKPFLQDNNRREQEARISVIKKSVFVLLILLLFVIGIYFRSGISSFVNSLFLPFLGFGNNTVENSAFVLKNFGSKSSLVVENELLKKEIEKFNVYKIENEFLRNENSRLNDLFNRTGERDVIATSALTIPGRSMFDTILVDSGVNNTKKKINPGDTVRVSENILIGDISEVFSKSSRVILFSSPGRSTEVYFDDSAIRFIAKGLGGGNFTVPVSKDLTISPGDFVYAANYGGLVVGIVSLVTEEPSDPFLNVRFRLVVNPYELNDLFIYERETDS